MLPLSRLTSLLFSPQQIKCLHFHTRIHFWNKLNLKCNKTKCFKMIEVKVVAGALGSVGWVWICTLRTAGVEGVTGAASVVFGRLMLQVPDPAHRRTDTRLSARRKMFYAAVFLTREVETRCFGLHSCVGETEAVSSRLLLTALLFLCSLRLGRGSAPIMSHARIRLRDIFVTMSD